MTTKGPRVALRRWFSWLESAKWHHEVWHTRLLCILHAGLRLGSYKRLEDTPLWGAWADSRFKALVAEGSVASGSQEVAKERREAVQVVI